MQAVVAVVRNYAESERLVESLREAGVPDRHISALSPQTPEAVLHAVPTTEAEQPGIGGTIGSVVGGATGAAGALAAASLALPGVGPVVAVGAVAVGLLGAMAGGAIGAGLDDALSRGLPADELYVYRDALRRDRTVVIAMVEDTAAASRVRALFASAGAESVDAAREDWWIGLRNAEEAEYTTQGGDFRKDEAYYRKGFEAASRMAAQPPPFDEAWPSLRTRHGRASDEPAFRAGYERARIHRSTAKGSGS